MSTLSIRKGQILVFKLDALRRSEDAVVKHLLDYFELHRSLSGANGLRKSAQYAFERARRHGWTSERDVTLYATLSVMLGAHFDEDLQLPWVQEILDPNYDSESIIDDLSNTAVNFFEDIAGEDGRLLVRPLVTARRALEGPLPLIDARDPGDDDKLIPFLASLFPAKACHIGESAIRQGVATSRERALLFGMYSASGALLFALASFLLGGGFERDPIYGEVGAVVTMSRPSEPRARSEALRQALGRMATRWEASLVRRA